MKYEHKKDMLRFYFDGELDNLSVMRLKEESIALIERFRPQVLKLDFASVTFVDSTGIGYVLALQTDAETPWRSGHMQSVRCK